MNLRHNLKPYRSHAAFAAMVVWILLLLVGCGAQPKQSLLSTQQVPEPTVDHVSGKAGDFELKLHAGKTEYAADEPIGIWATFKYSGEKSEIKIGHAMHYIGFDIVQLDGPLKFEGVMPTPYITTIIQKDVDNRTDYTKSVAYSDTDSNAAAYRKFAQGTDVLLPPGTYKVRATASFDLPEEKTENGRKPSYTIPLELVIRVR